jgi:hypothetical protein
MDVQGSGVLFVSYSFFDNDPGKADALGVGSSDLPTVLVARGGEGRFERTWRLQGWVERGAVASLLEGAAAESGQALHRAAEMTDLIEVPPAEQREAEAGAEAEGEGGGEGAAASECAA